MWYLIVSIPDLCTLTDFVNNQCDNAPDRALHSTEEEEEEEEGGEKEEEEEEEEEDLKAKIFFRRKELPFAERTFLPVYSYTDQGT